MSLSAGTVSGAPNDQGVGRRLVTLTGGRLTRHTIIYIVGLLAVAPFSLVSVAVLTRLLLPAQYGELGVLFVFAGFLTVFYNTGSLHGTFMLVYGASEGEGDDVGAEAKITSAPRRALGTGVVLTLMIVTLGTAVCFAFSTELSQALLHHRPGGYHREGASLVRWAAVSAAAGSLWRLTVNVFRMERRPGRFALFNATRPLFVIAGVVPLVVLGFGTKGALAGTALGTLGATAVCVGMARRSYALAFSPADVKRIVSLGSMVVVPVLCLYVVHSSDIILLSHFASTHELGIYRVASRFAVIPSYFASALLMTWAPLEHGVLFRATYKHVGEQRVRGTMLSYYLLVSVTIVVLLDVFANVLVLLAGREYRAAAPLIPLIGVAFVCYGLYIMLVRTVRVKQRMRWYSLGAVLAVALQWGLSPITIPWLGAYGAPLAVIVGLLAACAMWVALARREKASFGIQMRPLAGLAAATAIAACVQAVGLALWPSGRPAVLVLVLASYLIVLLAFRVIPKTHFRPLARLTRAALHSELGSKSQATGLARLDPAQRTVLASIERDGIGTAALAVQLGRSEQDIAIEYVLALRDLIGAPRAPAGAHELYPRIARYLLSSEPEAQRDLVGHQLMEQGADSLELIELDAAARRLRTLTDQEWTPAITPAPSARSRAGQRLAGVGEAL
jgi:O-antigen/teichoic acid export membrane protein